MKPSWSFRVYARFLICWSPSKLEKKQDKTIRLRYDNRVQNCQFTFKYCLSKFDKKTTTNRYSNPSIPLTAIHVGSFMYYKSVVSIKPMHNDQPSIGNLKIEQSRTRG